APGRLQNDAAGSLARVTVGRISGETGQPMTTPAPPTPLSAGRAPSPPNPHRVWNSDAASTLKEDGRCGIAVQFGGAGRGAGEVARQPGGCTGSGMVRHHESSSSGREFMHQPPVPHVASTDPQIAELIEAEARRQFEKLRMIASENYVSL